MTRVAVVALDDFALAVADGLEASGVAAAVVRTREPRAAFAGGPAAVVMPTLGVRPETLVADDLAFRTRIPLLAACMEDGQLILGPVVLPHRSACYHCHAARVAGQQGEADAAIAATPRADSERIGFLHGHVELTVTRLARNLRVVHADAPDAGAILCYVFSPFGLRRWPVERDRACPRCGAGALAAPRRPSSTPLAAVVSR